MTSTWNRGQSHRGQTASLHPESRELKFSGLLVNRGGYRNGYLLLPVPLENGNLQNGPIQTSLIIKTGAEEGTRTPTPLRVHGPEPCASANSATSAMKSAPGDGSARRRELHLYCNGNMGGVKPAQGALAVRSSLAKRKSRTNRGDPKPYASQERSQHGLTFYYHSSAGSNISALDKVIRDSCEEYLLGPYAQSRKQC